MKGPLKKDRFANRKCVMIFFLPAFITCLLLIPSSMQGSQVSKPQGLAYENQNLTSFNDAGCLLIIDRRLFITTLAGFNGLFVFAKCLYNVCYYFILAGGAVQVFFFFLIG